MKLTHLAMGQASPFRRVLTVSPLLFLLVLAPLPGCRNFFKRDKKEQFEIEAEVMAKKLADPDRPRLIGEVARASGVNVRRYESLGLVTNLPGTGGIVRPSTQREVMLEEIRRNGVVEAEEILDSPSTATAKLSVYANACDVKGDSLDVLIESSSECTATDLRDGYLMESHLYEYFSLKNKQLRRSNEKAVAAGELLIYPKSYSKEEEFNPLKGVVLGGARLRDSSRLAVIVNPDYRHASVVKAMETSINRRFFYQDGGKQKTVATGKNDYEIRLSPLPKYRFDPPHYLGTVLSLGYLESEEQIQERIDGCRRLLGNPQTARQAAWELEAIGSKTAAEVLSVALANPDDEIRFYAAYSLAHFDREECIPILQDLARFQPKFRAHCLIGLCINEHPAARAALEALLQEPEPELRFGAYHYLYLRDHRNPMVAGERIGEAFRMVSIPSSHSLVAVSMERRPEVIVFGNNPEIRLTKTLEPSPTLRLSPMSSGLVRVAKRTISGEVLQSIHSADVVSLIKAMPAIEGNYSDLVHLLDALEQCQACSAQIALHPLPRTARLYGQPDAADPSIINETSTEEEMTSSDEMPVGSGFETNVGSENGVGSQDGRWSEDGRESDAASSDARASARPREF